MSPLQDRIASMVHPFLDASRKGAVRDLARDVGAMEARVAELEERCNRLEEAARAVYIDSIVSDHPWTGLETRNMHALRDVLEAKP